MIQFVIEKIGSEREREKSLTIVFGFCFLLLDTGCALQIKKKKKKVLKIKNKRIIKAIAWQIDGIAEIEKMTEWGEKV